MLKRSFLILGLLIVACDSPSLPPTTLFTQNKMTIDYRIIIGESLYSNKKKQIESLIQATFEEIDHIYNKWNPSSEISQLNRLKAYEKRLLSPELYRFFQQVDTLISATEGKFDPTIEPLQNLWKEKLDRGLSPSKAELEEIQPCLGWNKIHFEKGIFYKEDSRTSLDFGGAAKGFCVDLLIERLNQAGFKNSFVEWGGEIRASGMHPEERSWVVFISRFEDCDPQNALAKVLIEDQAIATSGNYLQTWFLPDGKIYSHIFHPKKMEPIQVRPGAIASASVLSNSCMTADVFATALLLFDTMDEAEAWSTSLEDRYPDCKFWIWSR